MNQIQKLQLWYKLHCDGDWEHEYGIAISNIDNPGWCLKIDLTRTGLEGFSFPIVEVKNAANDWYAAKTEDNTFIGYGDCNKLDTLIDLFFLSFFKTNIQQSEFRYTVYASIITNTQVVIWRPFIAKMETLNEFTIIEKPRFEIKSLKTDDVKNFEDLNEDVISDTSEYKVNDKVACDLLFSFDFPILVIENVLSC